MKSSRAKRMVDRDKAHQLVAGIERLKQFRGKGETFKYLGAEMLVVALSESHHGGVMLGSITYPALVCEYMTESGIRRRVFYENDLKMLRRLNGESV